LLKDMLMLREDGGWLSFDLFVVYIIVFFITVHVLCILITFCLFVRGTFVCELVIKIILLIVIVIVTYVRLFPTQRENKKREETHRQRPADIP